MIAKVIVSINTKAVDKEFDYLIPEELLPILKIGDKVEFSFGKNNKKQTGYVIDIVEEYDSEFKLKYLDNIVDNAINVDKRNIQIARFINENYGSTLIQCLKTVLPIKKIIRSRIKKDDIKISEIQKKELVLADEQISILNKIYSDISDNKAKRYLIHGITGSGKTQIFIELTKKLIKLNKKVIILIPEISLTYQMVRRFIDNFSDRVGIIHSKLSEGEKYEQIQKAMRGEIDIMIGPRSAIFTPFKDIGAIIIDEEHDTAYKSDMSPKYDTREVAEYMSKTYDIPLILASATPSVETYYKVKNGDIHLFEMKRRRGESKLPNVEIIDMREEIRDGNFGMFSQKLINNMNKALLNNEQIILFINRRGYSNYMYCMSCGEPIMCDHCDVSYTYHKDVNMLKCHYCGSTKKPPTSCPNCASIHLDKSGFGTQKVEDNLNKLFPDYKVIRMDQDTTSRKNSYKKLLEDFHKHKADILVGTQMIIKGHDFPEVGLVGILNIDISLNLNSYKASERTFQTIVQASGRAGRRDKVGKAYIQTFQPSHYAIVNAVKNDYKSFYDMEMSYRSIMNYPPIMDFLKITISCKNAEELSIVTDRLVHYIEELKKDDMRVLGPCNERIYKLNDRYRKTIHIKGSKRIIKYFIKVCEYLLKNDIRFRSTSMVYEINSEN